METKKLIKVEKEEYKVTEAFCDFCKKKFNKESIEFDGYGTINFSFGYGSAFDDEKEFELHICDRCFGKKFAEMLKKQLDEKGYASETIKNIFEKKE